MRHSPPAAPSKRYQGTSLGETVRFLHDTITGGALILGGRPVHVMAFSREWAKPRQGDELGGRSPVAQEPSPMMKPNSCADWKKGQRRDLSRPAALGQGPPPFHGPAAILSSAARDATFRDEGQVWNEFMPSTPPSPRTTPTKRPDSTADWVNRPARCGSMLQSCESGRFRRRTLHVLQAQGRRSSTARRSAADREPRGW